MRFKPTKWKIIGSIVIPIIIWILVFILGRTGIVFENVPAIIRNFLSLHDLVNVFGLVNVSLFIIELIIVYIIWSLIQKKPEQVLQTSSPSAFLASKSNY